ncbi:NADH:quinone oxidoreductase [Pseudomonas sp. HLS-6]|jgi:electron transport complex protein RnfE|uniref:Rnf-Nqr domain containing protein n=1 Tax=Pseudomonas sp. HLS-6 TaxID=2049589 RepID=UPI000C1A18E8|nr:Rnf-Nqr domain containing protein [Pseudomonas sp. HLS-6]ATR84477.1 NADH:quinone oxidoreductase [Pseudomonas sp. HLS-6]
MNRHWLAGLSLAPLLGATQTLLQGASIAALSLLAILLHRLGMTPLRRLLTGIGAEVASMLLAATIVTCLELSLRAYALVLYQSLGLYTALIALQCVLFEHALVHAKSWRPPLSLLLGFAALCISLGVARELIGSGMRLAHLTPGALFLLGLLLALYNRTWRRRAPSSCQGIR